MSRDASSRVLASSDFASKVDIALLSARIDALTNAVDTLSEELRAAKLRKGRSH